MNNVFPKTIVQTCVIHLIRGSFRYVSSKRKDELAKDLKPIYQAVNPTAALTALDDLDNKWGTQYPALIRLWRNAWDEFIPFLDYDVEIRRVLYSTNAIESLNARNAGELVPCPWALPQYPSSHENLVPSNKISRPQRNRPETMGRALETSTKRIRHSIR